MSFPQQPQPGGYGGLQQPDYQLNASSQPVPGYLTPPVRSTGKGLAWTAIVLAIVGVVANPFATFLGTYVTINADNSFAASSLVYTLNSILTAVLALVGIVLAAIAVRQGARTLGGIGIGAGAFPLFALLLNVALTPLLYAFI